MIQSIRATAQGMPQYLLLNISYELSSIGPNIHSLQNEENIQKFDRSLIK